MYQTIKMYDTDVSSNEFSLKFKLVYPNYLCQNALSDYKYGIMVTVRLVQEQTYKSGRGYNRNFRPFTCYY